MPQVPYSPLASVQPTTQGTPEFKVNAPAAAFGGAVGEALRASGATLEHAGNEVFSRAIAIQQLRNETEAKEADANYMISTGEKHAQFSALQGKAAVDAYPKYVQDLQDSRKQIRDSLSNPMAQKMFDSSALQNMGRTIFNGAGHAATQDKVYSNNTSKAVVDTLKNDALNNPTDDKSFITSVNKTRLEIYHQGQLGGWSKEQIDNESNHQVSSLWSSRIEGLARTNPFKAKEMLEGNRNKILAHDLDRVDRIVSTNLNTTGSRNISDAVNAGWAPYMKQSDADRAVGVQEPLVRIVKEAQRAHPEIQFTIGDKPDPGTVGGSPPKGFIIHHTGGGGTPEGVENTLRQRRLGVEYIMDREGNITKSSGPGASHMKPGWGAGAGLDNSNTHGMEVIAKNDKDVTPAQRKAAADFIRKNYPNTPVYGHGEVNPGHKEADEGASIVGDIRAERGGKPVGSSIGLVPMNEGTQQAQIDMAVKEASEKLGIPLGEASNGSYSLPREYDTRTAPKAVEESLESRVSRATEYAKKSTPDDGTFHDYVRDRTISDFNRAKSIQRDADYTNTNTINGALTGNFGNVPHTVEELKALDPRVADAWNNLDETKQKKVIKDLTREKATKDDLERYQELKGMAENDPAAFSQIDVTGEKNLRDGTKKELINLQMKKYKDANADPKVSHAMSVLKPTIEAAGLDKDQKNKFTGALQDALTDAQSKSGKPPNAKEIQEIGAKLLQQQVKPGWLWNGTQHTFEVPVPDKEAEKIKTDPYWENKKIVPSEEMIQRIYTQKLYQQLYGGKASKSESPQPQVPQSQ